MSDNERILLAGLKALAAADAVEPPAALEIALRRKLAKKPALLGFFRRMKARPRVLALELGAAAAILTIALFSRRAPEPPADAFIPVPYTEPIGPDERAQILRVNVSLAGLARWGYPVTTNNPNRRVNAEVVLGEDGVARAFRLISTD